MRPRLHSLLLLLLAPLVLPAGARAATLNKVILRVNDQIATLYDYQKRRQELVQDLSRREMDEEERRRLLAQAPEIAFKDMYQDLLLESRAHQLAIEITDAQVDASVAQVRQNFGIKTDQEFKTALAQSGMTEEQLRGQMRDQLRVREVMDKEVRSRIKVDEEDQRRYYRKNLEQFRVPEQFHLREVVILDQGGLPTAEERSRLAAEIRQAVAGGKTLAEATAEQKEKGFTSSEVDLGWVAPGDLDKTLEAAAWKLKTGEVSEPVAGRGGLHLIQAVEHRESRIPPFSEVSSVIQSREQERVYSQEVAKYMTELEQKSLIVSDPPAEAAGFRRLITKPEAAEGGELRDLLTPAAVNPGAPSQASSPAGALPGTLPQPKPVTDTPPPVIAPPTADPAPPPPPPAR
jgi:parvulin-like peptidyl-prolyl isomerase